MVKGVVKATFKTDARWVIVRRGLKILCTAPGKFV